MPAPCPRIASPPNYGLQVTAGSVCPRYGFAEPKARSRARASTLRWDLEDVWDEGARQPVREWLSHDDTDPAHLKIIICNP